ncbi:MAG TPA: ATP-binding protein [Thermoanaerobaculia bacterium]
MADALEKAVLQAVIRQMPAGVIIAEAPSGRIIASNEQVETIWRHAPLASQSSAEYSEWKGFHPDGRPYSGEEWPLSRAAQGEIVDREEIRVQRGDGTYGHIRASARPVHHKGQIVAAVVTFFDITNERREQEALTLLAEVSAVAGESLRHDETLRGITRMAVPKFADAAFVHRIENGELRRSEVAAADPAVEERVRSMWSEFQPDVAPLLGIVETGQAVLAADVAGNAFDYVADETYRTALQAIGIRSAISVAMRADGRTFGVMSFVMTSSGRSFDAFDVLVAEEIGRRAGAAIERSRLFEAERAQRIRAELSSRRIERLQDLTTTLLAATTVESVCEAAIAATTRVVTGRATVIGVVRGEALHVIRTAGIAQDVVERFMTMPLDSPWPIVRAAATGEPLWLRNREEAIAAAPIIRDLSNGHAWACLPLLVDGHTIGALGFVFDEEQAFDEDERNYLTSIAGQCAIALERARLFESERKAREEAEAASRAKDEFLAVLSHELRTPMTTVIGWADLIKLTHGGDASLSGPLDALRSSARVQAKLVDDLLDVSRIITGKLSIEPQDVELTKVVRGAVASVQLAAEEKHITLDADIGAGPVPVEGDPHRLQQIVVNLLVNAIKFTPKSGRVRVRVTTRPGEADIAVADDGDGIAPEFLPHVFDRFRQASSGDSRRYTGLGLGLSIVQHLVRLHGGRVEAASEGLGKGARFTVTLPTRG